MPETWREVPPTAGLPLHWGDFVPGYGSSPLEERLATFLNVPSVQLECSGTAALIIALTTLKRASNRRSVIIPAYTCPLVALAVFHCGLKPLLCDVAPGSFDFSIESLERLCDNDVLAIIVTHLGGRVADLDLISSVGRRHGAFVIEDAAQSLGALWQGRKAGTIGDIGFFSLAAGKGLTLYEGGLLLAREYGLRKAIVETSAQIAPYRLLWELRRSLQLIGYGLSYRPNMLRIVYGVPLRLAIKTRRFTAAVGDDFTQDIPLHRVGTFRRAVGARAAARLPSFLGSLSAQAAIRRKVLESIRGLTVIGDNEGTCGTWPFFMVLLPAMEARDRALNELWTSGLGVTRLFIHALPDYPYLREQLGVSHVPNARDFAARMLTVSNSPWLSEDGFHRICSVLEKVLRGQQP